MKPDSIQRSQARYIAALFLLCNRGFNPLGSWRFEKAGKVYDLSAADLEQIERIEREGLFVEAESDGN